MSELAALDGVIGPAQEARIPVTDDGFRRGDGVFEAVRVYGGRPFAMAEHLDRMERSAANLRLGFEVPRADLEQESGRLLDERGGAAFDGILRLILTRGGHRVILTEPVPAGPERPRLGFVTYAPPRLLDGVKSLSYAANMLAGRVARERGFDEALLVTPHGRVLEAPTASIFWVDERGVIRTPPLEDHILASITRELVLGVVEVEEAPGTREDLIGAREVFLASTTREVQSVAAVEDTDFPRAGERTLQAAQLVREQIQRKLPAP